MGVGVCACASGAGLGSSGMFVPPRPIRMSAREKTVMRNSPSNAVARSNNLQPLSLSYTNAGSGEVKNGF